MRYPVVSKNVVDPFHFAQGKTFRARHDVEFTQNVTRFTTTKLTTSSAAATIHHKRLMMRPPQAIGAWFPRVAAGYLGMLSLKEADFEMRNVKCEAVKDSETKEHLDRIVSGL